MASYTPQQLQSMAAAAAAKYGVDPKVFLAQISQESGWNPNAHSGAGAEGIAQFMPGTAASYHIDPYNPAQALDAAAHYDANELKAFHGDYRQALAAYNAGAGNASKWNDPNFAGGQTYRYVRSILGAAGSDSMTQPTRMPANGSVSPADGTSASINAGGSLSRQQLAALIFGGANRIDFGSNQLQTPNLMALALARQQLAASTPPPSVQAKASKMVGGKPPADISGLGPAGGFLAPGSPYQPGRIDQGHDFQTAPGAPIVAPGDGTVVAVKSDPNGFGPSYPIVHFTSGPYAGKDIYIGHTLAALPPGQKFRAGQTISHTGTTPIGNASVPGWAEIGFSTGSLPSGQSPPF